jgi:hypothetical protein
MILGAQRNVMAVLHATEGGLHMMLASIASDDLHISPLVVVRKEDRLSEQGFLQTIPCSVVESVSQAWEPLGLRNLHLEAVMSG